MSDEILDQYEKTLEAAVVPSYFLPEQFCNNGVQSVDYIIPPAFSANPKQASLETGAPPLQQVKPNLGGAYFPRQEYNGILRLVTNILAYLNSGYNFTFDTKNTGGYQSNAVLFDYATGKWVQSLQDGNTNNFVENPNLIDGTHWKFITVNPNVVNDFTVSPTAPTAALGTNTAQIATMAALWNQTRGIGIGLQGQTIQTFNTVGDLTSNTVSGGCYFAGGSIFPIGDEFYYLTRVASRDSGNGSSSFLAIGDYSGKSYIGNVAIDGITLIWTQLATVEQLQNGTFAAILLSLVAQTATFTSGVAIYGNQPTNPVNFLFAGNGSAGAGAFIEANYDNVNQVAFINFPYKLSDGITLARPCLGNSNAASDQIAKLADITANGGGIVASGGSDGAMWVLFANGLILQTVAVQVALVPNGTAFGSIALPKSITNRTTYSVQSSFGEGALVNGRISADIPGTTTITYNLYNNNANTGNQIIEFFVWSY